jgi:cytochrome c oxidase assembly factor CtaG
MSHPLAPGADLVGQDWTLAWTADPWVVLPLAASAGLYLRGWAQLHPLLRRRLGAWRPAAFLGGLATIFLALASPLDRFAKLLLQLHMTQHLLLMMLTPPLLWLGAPVAPLLRGLPQPVRRLVASWLARPPVRRFARFLGHPVTCWLAFVAAVWAWHIPALYELALRGHGWHHLQHACFFATSLLFWWPVVQPWPARPVWPRWTAIPYLLLADVQNTVLSALLAFADRVIYPAYAAAPRLWQISALEDQAAAGAIMWVPGGAAFVLIGAWVVYGLLTPRMTAPHAPRVSSTSIAHPNAAEPSR